MEKQKVSLTEDFKKFWLPFQLVFTEPIIEVYRGFQEKSLPMIQCFLFGTIASVASYYGLFAKLFERYLHLHLRFNNFFSGVIGFLFVWSGLYFWGLRQQGFRRRLQDKLSRTFLEAGLRTKLDEFPEFVFDRPTGSTSRMLRVRAKGISAKRFRDQYDTLQTGLNVFISKIENPNDNRELVDIIYTIEKMPAFWHLDSFSNYKNYSFPIGKTLDGELIADLRKIPHYLVAGETGSGKSTFIRAMTAVLSMNNHDLRVIFIDMKCGMENQVFSGMNQVEIISDVGPAEEKMNYIDGLLTSRMKLASESQAKSIDEFNNKKENHGKKWERYLIVVDEAAELMPTFASIDKAKLAKIQSVLNRLTRLGRAVGLHVAIGVQKPDHKNLDVTTKANLPGIVCFPVSHFNQSVVILGNGHAADLNKDIPGRGIWKHGLFEVEFQAPFMSQKDVTEANERCAKYFKSESSTSKDQKQSEEKNSQTPASYKSGSRDPKISLEMEARQHADT